MTDDSTTAPMSEYDRAAWDAIHARLSKTSRTSKIIPPAIARRAVRAGKSLAKTADRVPGADDVKTAVENALQGFEGLLTKGAHASLPATAVLKAFGQAGHDLAEIEGIRSLSLKDADKVTGNLGLRYAIASSAEGAVAGLAVSGGEIVAAGGGILGAGAGAAPGVGLMITAIAGDAAATLFACRRAVAHVALSYGYDVRQPEEEAIAAKALGFGLASGGAKVAAFRELNGLVHGLARRKAWAELNQNVITVAVREIYKRLGYTLTQRKLAQAVPVLGIAIGAGMNARALQGVVRDAQDFYRRRFLCERYGLPFTSQAPGVTDDAPDPEVILNVQVVVDEVDSPPDARGE